MTKEMRLQERDDKRWAERKRGRCILKDDSETKIISFERFYFMNN